MRAARYIAAVDSHTEGMPTRVVTGGVGPIPGATMLERKLHFEAELDDLRLLLMREPRGHSALWGAILQPPTRPDADWGVLFIEVSGLLPMCGHGTIGVATVLVETGMVAVTEPETVVALDTPAGLVRVRVAVQDGRATAVTLRNVPSFLLARDREIAAAPRLEILVGGDDWALEGFAAGATGWVTGVADVAPRECVELYEAVRANDLGTARDVYRRMLPVARFDMTSKLVQYFKAAQDAVGFNGGPTRAPRLPLKPAEVEALDAALAVLREPAVA